MTTKTKITIKLSQLRPSLQHAIENITARTIQAASTEEPLTLDSLAQAATSAISLAESMLRDDPDDREARSLVYDSETVRNWLQSMIFL